MKPIDALTSPPLSGELEPKVSQVTSAERRSAQAIFRETLEHISSVQSDRSESQCWLLLMARQLGLSDPEALELTTPYPALNAALACQLSALSARADAERAEQQDDLQGAISSYERHLSASPYDDVSRLKLGRLLLRHGERRRVKALYQEALTLHEGPCVLALKAELLISHRRFDEAYLSATEAWEQAPTHPEVLITLSKTQRWMLNHEAERDSLDRALQAHAHHPVALALSLQAEDPSWLPHLRLEEVSKEFARRPTRHMHLALINALLCAHKYDLALTECRRLLPRDPKDIEVKVALVQSLTYLGHTTEATAVLTEVLQSDARHPIGLHLQCFLSLLDQDLKGADALQKLSELALRSSMASLLYSQALSLRGKQSEAHRVCQTLYRKYPRRAATLNAYCQSLIELNEHALVEELCLERLEYYPQDLPVRLSLTEVLLSRGRVKEALKHLEELLPHPKAQELMVKVAHDHGDPQLVFERSTALLRERPCSPDLIEYAVNAILELNNLEDHLRLLSELISIENLYPNQAALILQLRLIIGDLAEAQRILSSLSSRPPIALSDERLMSVCEAARRLQDPLALQHWVERGLQRRPSELRLQFLHTVALWWSGEHDKAVERLFELYHTHDGQLPEEELITLTVWLCELKRGYEARPILDQLYQLPSYLQGVLDAGGLDVIKARVLLFASSEEERQLALRTLLSWLEQVKLDGGETVDPSEAGDAHEHPYHEVSDRVISWLLDVEERELALQLIEQEIAEDNQDPARWSVALKVYQTIGDLDLTLFALNQLRSLGELNDRLLLDRAETLEALSRPADSLQAYHEAYQLIPESYEVRLERALALIRAQHLPAAELELIDLLEIARQEDELGGESELDRGLPSLQQAHFNLPGDSGDQAHVAPSTIHTLGPIREHVLFLWLSQVFEHAPLEEAISTLERLELPYLSSAYIVGFKGLVKLWAGQTSEALPLLRQGSARDQYFALEYARALWECGLRRFAVAVLQECVLKAPQDVEYHKLLIERLIELGDAYSAHSYLLSLSCLDQAEAEALSETLYESLTAH